MKTAVSSITASALLVLFSFSGILVSCYGRPAVQPADVSPANFGVQPGRSAVVSFSSLWCHPCREEIETLNQAQKEFAGQVQIVGFLVEGEEKGDAVQPSDIENFKTFSGEKPTYTVHTDQDWRLFDALQAPQGRALPTLVIFNQQGRLQEIVQQSLDYNTQLRPLLQALARGENPAPIGSPPVPAPPPHAGQSLNDSVQNWSSRPEVSAHPSLLKNLTVAWQMGLQKYDFTAAEMPLADGKIAFFWDGADQNTPQNVRWAAETAVSICQLQLNLNPDATLISATGTCRPK